VAPERNFLLPGQDQIVIEAILDQILEIGLLFHQINVSRLELGEIKEVTDEIHQIAAVTLNLGKPLLLFLIDRSKQTILKHRSSRNHSRQRSPQVVSNHGGEVCLCLVRLLQLKRLFSCLLQKPGIFQGNGRAVG
jgi:hypothetical protein